MVYCKTYLEEFVENLYTTLSIQNPSQLDYQIIAKQLGIRVKDTFGSSTCLQGGSVSYILLNNKLSKESKWQEFAHELCHLLRHAGNQLTVPEPFLEMQEWQANSFALHFCIPTFMLEKLDLSAYKQVTIAEIAQTFGVEYDFAEERLERWLLQRAIVYYG
ncbi:ImmA/IrrE family metallo-endopeptidase [Domibacillus aminovorans]|uniref:ImmA/IrrE family metallo-endopeptidase n=1 Tax=Domibacillus aminovorans TaxID=29332 RepID=UPI003D203E3D